jgi:hypothetical protein
MPPTTGSESSIPPGPTMGSDVSMSERTDFQFFAAHSPARNASANASA